MKNPKLSIVILSYNVRELLMGCLNSIKDADISIPFEVIVIDNASKDESGNMVIKEFPEYRLIQNSKNLGFAAGNNIAKDIVRGEYVLFLNPDTKVFPEVIEKTLLYLNNNPEVGALSCKLVLDNGKLDLDVRRSFITPWIGFSHLILRADKIFPRSKLFGKYWYGYINENTTHEVDVIQGAFMLVRKKILDSINWFDEDYFLDGEDVDLCFRIKEKGWKIIYFPKVKIIHYKGASKGKKAESRVGVKNKLRYRMSGVNSMELFYRKRLWSKYPLILNYFVIAGIKLIKIQRVLQTIILG